MVNLRISSHFLLSISICFSSVFPVQAENHSEQENNRNCAQIELIGKAPIGLRKREGGSYHVYVQNQKVHMSGVLVSIDQRDLSKLDEDAIKRLLLGPIGTSIDVTILTNKGSAKIYKVERESINRKPLWERDIQNLSSLDNRNPNCWNDSCAEDSLDIEARAGQTIILHNADELSEVSRNSKCAIFLCAALTNYQVGNLRDGDKYLRQGLQEYDPSEDFRLGQNWDLRKAVSLLIKVNRLHEATRLCEMELHKNDPASSLAAFKELVFYQFKCDKDAGLALLEKIYTTEKTPGLGIYNRKWICEVFAKAGEYEKALAACEKDYKLQYVQASNWETAQQLGALVLARAYAQHKLMQNAEAIKDLDAVIKKFESCVSAEQNTAIESMPGVYPKPSDLRRTLNDLRSGREIELRLDIDPSGQYDLPIRACHQAIESGDQKFAKKCLDDLLGRYTGTVPQASEAFGELNLYSSILTLAREVSDRKWYGLADSTLLQLKEKAYGKDANDVARIFLQFEIAFNTRDLETARTQWKNLRNMYQVEPVDWGKSLRQLAVAFYYANEFERAEYLIDKAFAASNNEIENSPQNTVRTTDEITMTQIYAACIAARQKRFDRADNLWKQVVSQQSLKEEGYRFAAMELSSIYRSLGDTKKAIQILQAIHSKPSKTVMEVGNATTALDLQLAKLLLESGQTTEAYIIAKAAEKPMRECLEWDQHIIVAKCAEASSDFELAASNYGLARQKSSGVGIFGQNNSVLYYLEKAMNFAEKVPGFDRNKLVAIYKDYAQSIPFDSGKTQSALDAYRKAYALLPESDPEKTTLLINMANLKAYIDRSPYKPELTKNRSGISDDYLKSQEEAAQMSERNHQMDTRGLWASVVNSKAARGELGAAIVDAKHLMQLYSSKDAEQHSGILMGSALIRCLVRQGRIKEAEQLLVEALQRTKLVAGDKNIATQAQCVDLFEFYFTQNEYTSALRALKESLNGNLTTGETLTQSLTHSHCGPGWQQSADAVELVRSILNILSEKDRTANESSDAFVRDAIQVVLRAQQAALQPNDERIVPTLAQLGDCLFKLQNYNEAHEHYTRAYEITKRYHKGEFAVRQVGEHFLENLRKLGRSSEASELANLD